VCSSDLGKTAVGDPRWLAPVRRLAGSGRNASVVWTLVGVGPRLVIAYHIRYSCLLFVVLGLKNHQDDSNLTPWPKSKVATDPPKVMK
jgi:hypothetical protein